MRGWGIGVLVSGVLLAGSAAACNVPAGAAGAKAGLLAQINAERAAQGLAAYRPSEALDRAARTQACDTAIHGYFAHERPGAPQLGARVKASGYALRAVAENIAYTSQLDPGTVGRLWKQSPPHRAAMMDPGHRDIGLALAAGGGRIYWVMVVAR